MKSYAKKFSVAILSVLCLLLGGLLLSSCGKTVSMSVSETEVTISTNNSNAENYQTKQISVTLSNSDGLDVFVIEGQEVVLASSTHKSGDIYTVTITAVNSGDALVRVYARDDYSVSEDIIVHVETWTEEITATSDDTTDGKSNMFVIKGSSKELVSSDLLDFSPVTANVKDVIWTFENDSIEGAYLENDILYVTEDCTSSEIVLRATFAYDDSVYTTITFEVLDNSTISSLSIETVNSTIDGEEASGQITLIDNGEEIWGTSEIIFELKRNDATRSVASGTITVNTSYDVELGLVVLQQNSDGSWTTLSQSEYNSYLKFNVTASSTTTSGVVTYSFQINALDEDSVKSYGTFKFYLSVGYENYNYAITTEDVNTYIDSSYLVEKVELYNEDGDIINNTTLEVYSNYSNGSYGYTIRVVLSPTDVNVDNNMFYISIDTNQSSVLSNIEGISDIATFYYRGSELTFTQNAVGSSTYITTELQSGVEIQVKASENISDILENIVFNFVPVSNPNNYTSLSMNLYKISSGGTMDVTDEDGGDVETQYISSSSASTGSRALTYTLKVYGISSITGLSLVDSGNQRFLFSSLSLVSSYSGSSTDGDDKYVIVTFTVSLVGYDFESETTFYLEHITGKISGSFDIVAFVPLTSATITNASTGSTNVIKSTNSSQSYVYDESISTSGSSDTSLAYLLVEAGATISLNTTYQSLSDSGVTYKYLSFDSFVTLVKGVEGITDNDTATTVARTIFNGSASSGLGIDYAITNFYSSFVDVDGTLFTITESRLTLTSNDFQGFVIAVFDGYDESHNSMVLVRGFALESFFSVTNFTSSVRETTLYTQETLSSADVERSYVDVAISFRSDSIAPTYTGDLSYFTFTSEQGLTILVDGTVVGDGTSSDVYYSISNLQYYSSGRYFYFRITAISTKLSTVVEDTIRVTYTDPNGITKSTEIKLTIKNVDRVESVTWVNQTSDGEIYLNLTSSDTSEKQATITTTISPSSANDKTLTYVYIALTGGTTSNLNITTNDTAQTFNLSIGSEVGGTGYLFLLPSDMIKTVDGVSQVLVYKYTYNSDGSITETPSYVRLTELDKYYSDIIGEDENDDDDGDYSNYFINNDGEKVYYSNIILRIKVTIADGESEETAIRIYNESELKNIDTAKYYRIMNNITLTNWTSFTTFSGMLFGNDETITLTLTGTSGVFIETNNGTIKDLIFAGTVYDSSGETYSGFIARVNNGTIQNVSVDVYYSSNVYASSSLSTDASNYVGGLVGVNNGSIIDSFSYGLTISATSASYVGGIAGKNEGTISGSGVEFYNFSSTSSLSAATPNTVTISGYFGGIVGYASSGSKITLSYIYAYPLADGGDYTSLIIGATSVGLLVAYNEENVTINESFGFLGTYSNLTATINDLTSNDLTIKNSYVSYYSSSSVVTNLIVSASYSVSGDYSGTYYIYNNASSASAGYSELDSEIWEVETIDEDINFGFAYLKNISQNVAYDVTNLSINDILSPYTQALQVSTQSGILFYYSVNETITSSAEQSDLTNHNTISLADLFGLTTTKQARTLVLSTDSSNISIGTTSIEVLSKNTTAFEVVVYSKMDFTQSVTLQFVVFNSLPTLITTQNGTELTSGQTILLQSGKTLNITQTLDYSIYLNGSSTAYQMVKGSYYEYGFSINGNTRKDSSSITAVDDFVSVSQNGSTLTLYGKSSHGDDDELTTIQTFITLSGLDLSSAYTSVIEEQQYKTFSVDVYDGATELLVSGTDYTFKTSEYAEFDVTVVSDNSQENLVFSLTYGDSEVTASSDSDTRSVSFEVDNKFLLDVTWSLTSSSNGTYKYHVIARVNSSYLHLVDQTYELQLSVNALSQSSNNTYLKTVNLTINTQNVESISIQTYSVENRAVYGSTTYYRASSSVINTLTPSSDAIVAVTVSPAYAQMTSFTLTYEVTGSGSGTITISKLAYNSNYGYYINSANTSSITNGISVTLTDDDRTGSGVYYFRIYAYSTFSADCDVKLTVTFYNGSEVLTWGSYDLIVDYLASADVKVNGQSTTLLAKGDTATVTVTVDSDQTLYSYSLTNISSGVTLSAWTEEVSGSQKVYTATLTVLLDAVLTNGNSNGIFYITAEVARTVNGEQEIKTSRASIYLVDFTLDTSSISLNSSGGTSTYNGKTYDVFYSYIGATDSLSFTYSLLPETYSTYDSSDPDQVSEYNRIQEEKNKFLLNNYYASEDAGYYINYQYNSSTGEYDALLLKQQLSYATSEGDGTSNSIYNSNYDSITQNDLFYIYENENTNLLEITGRRSGRQLMKLTTTIIYQNTTFTYDYYFLIVVDIWSDEEIPTQITTAEEFVDYATNSEQADDYILMNDIVLDDYTPVSTDLISSLDGNGYTIHINSFAMPDDTSTLSLALFDTVSEDTILKNVRVNIYSGGQIDVNVTQYTTINIAGLAIENNGIIYNCEVLSYKSDYQTTVYSTNGIVVNYMLGSNTDAIGLTDSMLSQYGVTSNVAGLVITNNSSIVNSRVGGTSYRAIVDIGGQDYIQSQSLGTFTIQGQDNVAGFVLTNLGTISACFASNVQINNDTETTLSLTSGFVLTNSGTIQGSYSQGVVSDDDEDSAQFTGSNIATMGYVAGFVYENSGEIKNSYSNIAIENDVKRPSFAAGFVYINSGTISLCYSASQVRTDDSQQMPFSGVDANGQSLNTGSITNSYFYSSNDTSNQTTLTPGVVAVGSEFVNDPENTLYGFSFSSGNGATDGIWEVADEGVITLVSANDISFSNRYAITSGTTTSMYYTTSLVDASTLQIVTLSYGSANNPIIIRDAYDFAMATGDATGDGGISSYAQYYSDTEVFGNYRLVYDVDMSEIDQNSEEDGSVKLQTTGKTFSGVLDGNGFTISNINLGSSDTLESYGLFAKLDTAIIKNINFIVESVHDAQANIVGTLAGVAFDSCLVAITISPSSSSDDSTSILGNNIVGGVVGMLMGQSRVSDITASNIDVYSSYNDGTNKTVGSNDTYVSALRNLVENGSELTSTVSKLSYAGAIAGFVDIYSNTDTSTVAFSTALTMSDYDLIKMHVTGSVNIYAEVAGGLFGYVGNSTYIYDASLELDAPMDNSNTSYIVGKNLYAGGLIGENYGGLFAVYASYSETLQEEIEENEISYYNGSSSVERGQMNIFSYKVNDTDAPLYIGGLVGYMGGGYIYTGYSKLNVISESASTIAVGGIIGIADYTSNTYEVSFITNSPQANILLYDVYASGDLYISTGSGVSGGIIGAIGQNNGSSPAIVLKDVLAMNYYSYSGNTLSGDTLGDDGNSERHFAIIGRIVRTTTNDIVDSLSSNIYIVRSTNDYFNLRTGASSEQSLLGSSTVGGYFNVVTSSGTIGLNLFGFSSSATDENIMQNVLEATSIGSMTSISSAYRTFSSYFIDNGWSDEYWVHSQDDLFPHIQLTPQNNYYYWDIYNTEYILNVMSESSSGTVIIVRGKVVEDDTNNEYADINLAEYIGSIDISNFKGTLISYESYLNDSSVANVNVYRYSDSSFGTVNNEGVGGTLGDAVGIIIDESLFTTIESATIQGLNIYFVADSTSSDGSSVVTYSLVEGSTNSTSPVSKAVFRELNLVYNGNISLTTQTYTEGGIQAAGLITPRAYASTFLNISISIRTSNANNASITLTGVDDDKDTYLGILAGYMEQNETFTSMSVEGLTFNNIVVRSSVSTTSTVPIQINFINGSSDNNLYAGLYTGLVKNATGGTIQFVLTELPNVTVNISSSSREVKNLYVGGYVGKSEGSITVQFYSSDNASENGITINQNTNVSGTLYAGLVFGILDGASYFTNTSGSISLVGAIYQGSTYTTANANVGGLVGYSNAEITISGVSVNLTVAKLTGSSTPTYTDSGNSIFELSKYSYDVSPFIVSGNYSDDSFGGLIGYSASSASVTLSGTVSVSGIIDVGISSTESSDHYISVGGIIGKLTGNITTNVNITNTLNISVQGQSVQSDTGITDIAYVGGMIGWWAGVDGSAGTMSINYDSSLYVSYTGNVLSNIAKLYFGGAVGYINKDYSSDTMIISNVVYGGAVRVYGSYFDGGAVYVGGVVGGFNLSSDDESNISNGTSNIENSLFTIQNSYTYGDVFVNYQSYSSGKYNDCSLNTYNFGGIVGSATYMTISNCYTIMTSFNSRLSTISASSSVTVGTYNVNAIVGGNSSTVVVKYDNNYYSSGVNLAYQEEDGNIDLPYYNPDDGTVKYQGYTNLTGKEDTEENSLTQSVSILESFANVSSIGSSSNYNRGHKLNPYSYTGSADSGSIKYDSSSGTNKIGLSSETLSSYHGISWVAVVTESSEEATSTAIEIDGPIASQLVNVAFVGNGQTITLTDDRSSTNGDSFSTSGIGGLVDYMGLTSTTDDPNFTIISGLIIDADISVNIDLEKGAYYYGAVAGAMYGNSFIYGVGVKGEVSVGSSNTSSTTNNLWLGGMVGRMTSGFINQSYIDADVIYRANESGYVAGVANIDTNSTIMATYSSGLIETYVNVPIFTFASFLSGSDDTRSTFVIDCYSISQTSRTSVTGDTTTADKGTYFIYDRTSNSSSLPDYVKLDNVFNGSDNVENGDESNVATASADDYSLSYSDYENITKGKSFKPEEAKNDEVTDTFSTWYFSPYVNYGYASHGFGYLKNVTTYTRTSSTTSSSTDDSETSSGTTTTTTSVITTYEYTVVDYADILEYGGEGMTEDLGWYLGVPNSGKFEQMIATVLNDEENNSSYTNTETTHYYYRFVLNYDIDMEEVNANYLARNIGVSGNNFVFDGNNHTLDFSYTEDSYEYNEEDGKYTTDYGESLTKSLFGEVIGDIENLRISDINISSSTNATLASKVTGNLTNIVVIGNLTTTVAGVVGGVVAELEGNATAIQSMVNITRNLTATLTDIAVTGGVIGSLNGGTVSYSSNSGNVEVTVSLSVTRANVSNAYNYTFIPVNSSQGLDNSSYTTVTSDGTTYYIYSNGNTIYYFFAEVVGGVVGYSNGGEISNSYNAGSVLAEYTGTNSNNAVAGGIVGYSVATSISNAYNTGLIGAGNYSNSYYAYAGGIFGYAIDGGTISGCVNDGQVEALGKMSVSDSDWEITYVLMNDGEETTSSYSTNPENLVYEVTITYNVGKNRYVYAYGIGTIGSGTSSAIITGCSTSTDNIINDGIVGEVSDTQTMTFDRATMIQQATNSNGESLFKASFSVETNYYINGYDSYGFPARIYTNDTMTRMLATDWLKDLAETNTMPEERDGDVGWLDTDIHYYSLVIDYINSTTGESTEFSAYTYWDGFLSRNNNNAKNSRVENGEANYVTYAAYNADNGTDSDSNGITDYTSSDFTEYEETIYYLSADTTYYSSVSFIEYDQILKGVGSDGTTSTGLGLMAYDCNIPSDRTTVKGNIESDGGVSEYERTNTTSVESLIEKIDDALETSSDSIESFYVNGQNVAVVKNKNNFISVIAPYSITVTSEFTITDSNVDINSINRDNVTISVSGSVQTQYKSVKVTTEGNTVSVSATLYFSEKVEGVNVTTTLTYDSEEITFVLGKNNTTFNSNGSLTIALDSVSSATSEDYYNSDDIRVEYNGNSTDVENSQFSYSNASGIVYLTLTADDLNRLGLTTTNINNQTITIYRTLSVAKDTDVDAIVTTTSSSKTVTIDSYLGSSDSIQFNTIVSDTFDNNVFTTEEDIYETMDDGSGTEEQVYTGTKIALSEIGDYINYTSYSRVVLGYGTGNDYYSISYVDGEWRVTDNVDDDIDLTIDENYLVISGSVEDVSEFIENMANWTYYYSSINYSSSSPYYIGTPSSIVTDDYTLSGVYVSYNDAFVITVDENNEYYVYYDTNKGDIESQDGTTKSEDTYFGVTFYTVSVTFEAKLTDVTLNLLEEDGSSATNVGYDIQVTRDGETVLVRQGAATTSNQVDLGSYVEYGDKISYTITTTSFSYGDETLSDVTINYSEAYTISLEYMDVTIQAFKDEELTYITTFYSYDVGDSEYSYNYTIYDDGSIEIEVYYYNYVSKSDDSYDVEFIIYEYIIDSGGTVTGTMSSGYYNIDENGKFTETDEDGNVIAYYDEENVEISSTIDILNGVTINGTKISFDLIVGDFDENNIYFVKNDLDLNDDDILTTSVTTSGAENQKEYDIVTLYSDNDENYTITITESSGETLKSVQVKNVTENGDWEDSKNGGVYYASEDYSSTTYKYKYTKYQSSTSSNQDAEGEETTFSIMIFASDISLGDMTTGFTSNSVTINGNSYVLKFLSASTDDDTSELFTSNSGDIMNLNIVVQKVDRSSSSTSSSAVLFGTTSGTTGNLSNVKIFGNYRNIVATGTDSTTTYVIGTVSSTDSSIVLDVDSSVTLDGANATSGNDVERTLSQYYITLNSINVNYISREIIVCGSAVKGDNGTEGDITQIVNNKITVNRTSYGSKSYGNGGNGDDGGNGGTAELQVASVYERDGLSSIGGYGGNGAHGSKVNDTIYGGGGGGKAGTKGTETGTTGNYVLNDQYGGNGGVGGLGYFMIGEDSSEYYITYVSSGPGDGGNASYSGAAGDVGTSYGSIDTQEKGYYVLMTVYSSSDSGLNKSAHCHTTYIENFYEKHEVAEKAYIEWYQFWNALAISVTQDELSLYINNSTSDIYGSGTPVSQLYVRLGIEYDYKQKFSFFTYWDLNRHHYFKNIILTKYIWTSGETVNSGGSYGLGCAGSSTSYAGSSTSYN